MTMRVMVARMNKAVSVKGVKIAVRAWAYARTQAAVGSPTAVGHCINLSEGDTEEPGRSDGNHFSQQHRCLNTKPTGRRTRSTLSAFGAVISIACAIKQSG
jgi:hypothetical protein